jgi:hypothetical protein
MKININDFVGLTDVRVWMRQPIQIAGKLTATDGRSVFMSNKGSDLPDPETESLEKINVYLGLAEASGFYPMPKLNFPETPLCTECKGSGKHSTKDCPECDGLGTAEAETDYHTYQVECRTCYGDGKIDCGQTDQDCECCGGKGKRWTKEDRMQVDGIPFDMNPELMSRIADVRGMHIALIKSDRIRSSIAFKCADGIGIIMGMTGAKSLVEIEYKGAA